MASRTSIARLVLFWLGLCRFSCGQTPGKTACERIKSCSCLGRHVVCRNGGLSRVPEGIPSDTTSLDLSHNNIEEINVKALAHLKSLQKLFLYHNIIKNIPSWGDLPSTLTVLSLHHNKISAIPSFNTSKELRLRSLYLHSNKISSLGKNAFANLTKLKTLKLNRNKLKVIPTFALSRLNSLVSLDLRKNEISSIPRASFRGLPQLKILKLSKNRISGMENMAFLGLDKLEQIHLDWNNFSVLEIAWFFGMTNLQKLFLQDNQILQIKTDRTDWRSFDFICEINLARNRLSNINNLTFRDLMSLRNLNLAGNNIYHITQNAFSDLHRLESLDLHNNAISWTVEEMTGPFSGLKNLIFLRLDGNRITAISENAFLGLSSLRYLNLSANIIGTVQENAFSEMKKLTKLWLNTSHLMCDCKIKWMSGWFVTHLETLDSINARCNLPQHLHLKSIFNISSSLFVCDASTSSPLISRHPSATKALIGQNVTMSCEVEVFQHNETNVRLTWTRNHDDFIKTDLIMNHAKATTENMVTYISVLRLARVGFHDDGFYQCHASNSFGAAYSKRAKLDIREFPVFIKKPKNITVSVGETIRLPCGASGHPKPTLSWRKDKGSTMFSAAEERRIVHHQSQNLFLITNSKAKDTGFYTCSATNDAGSINYTAYVTVQQIPRFMQSMSSKTVKEGESVVLECIANGSPPPRFKWLKDRQKLALNTRVLTHLNGQLVVIIRAELEDDGLYVCEVTNKLGTARQSARLTVLTGEEESNSKEDKETSAFRYDKKTFLGIIVIVVVSCVVGTSLVWLLVIYCARRNSHRRHRNEALHTTTAPREDVSYIPLKSYSSGSTQTSRDSPRSTATFLTSSGSQASTFPPSTASSEQNCEINEKPLPVDNISTETSKGSHSSLASSCPSDESEPIRQVIHVQIHNSDSDSDKSAPTHRKEANRDSKQCCITDDCKCNTPQQCSTTHV